MTKFLDDSAWLLLEKLKNIFFNQKLYLQNISRIFQDDDENDDDDCDDDDDDDDDDDHACARVHACVH